jgi:hypothetical protein
MQRSVGQALRTGAACRCFRDHLADVRSTQPPPTAWSSVEAGFLAAIAAFDDQVSAGNASEGERQNGKGDYFNDLVAIILENCSALELSKRAGVPGLIFPKHNLDVTYPATGDIVRVLVEAKMMGTPRHSGSPKAKAYGRPGSADMLKRCKESGFKTIDLKAGYGYRLSQSGRGQQQEISGDLTTWLRTVLPHSYMAVGARVVGSKDYEAVVATARAMTQVVDGIGIATYRPKGYLPKNLMPAAYETVPVPNDLSLGPVLHRICQDLRAAAHAAASSPSELKRAAVATPAEAIPSAPGDEDEDEDDA